MGRGSRSVSLAAALACGVVLAFPAPAEEVPDRVTGVITGVLDGDTLRVQLRSGPSVVRLAYVDAPRLWGLSALFDQHIGGLIMWIPGALVYFVVLTGVFFRWLNRDEYQRSHDAQQVVR